MSYFVQKAEKDKIRGKDLKSLIEENTVVLVYNNYKIYAVDPEAYYVKVLKGLSQRSENKVVFVSNSLKELEKLDDYEEYTINFVKNGLEVWYARRKDPSDLALFISGITL